MKLGEIKLEALRLMFASYNEELTVEQLSALTHSQEYGQYLIAMPGSINRCFADLELRGVLPLKSAALAREAAEEVCGMLRWELPRVLADYLAPVCLICEWEGGSFTETELAQYREGDILRLPIFDPERKGYRLVYRPRLPRILSYTDDTVELPIPDRIAAFIPYWIKGELFREDEPGEAGEARNWYEVAMDRAVAFAADRRGSVRSVYSMTEV